VGSLVSMNGRCCRRQLDHGSQCGWGPPPTRSAPSLCLTPAGFEVFFVVSLFVLVIILPINCTGSEVDKLMSSSVRLWLLLSFAFRLPSCIALPVPSLRKPAGPAPVLGLVLCVGRHTCQPCAVCCLQSAAVRGKIMQRLLVLSQCGPDRGLLPSSLPGCRPPRA
jgi:hypothetical protein